jgi:hypothetical protein
MGCYCLCPHPYIFTIHDEFPVSFIAIGSVSLNPKYESFLPVAFPPLGHMPMCSVISQNKQSVASVPVLRKYLDTLSDVISQLLQVPHIMRSGLLIGSVFPSSLATTVFI